MKLLENWILRLHIYTSSLTKTQGNAVNGISKTVSFCTNFTNHFFSSPHTWNKTTGLVEIGESKWNWRSKVWKIISCISLIVTLTQILMEFRYALFFREDPTFTILFRRVQILGSSLLLITQCNTVWNVTVYKEFINQVLRTLRLVEQDRILPPSTFNRIFWVTRILTILFFLILLYLPVSFVILISYPEVYPNLFSTLLPGVFSPTSVVGRREHWNPFVAFGVGMLEFTVLSQQCCHALNYASFVSIVSISWLQLFQEMKYIFTTNKDCVHMDFVLLDMNYFIKIYKAMYLVSNRLNDWIASIVIPGVLSTGIALIVFVNYILLTTTTNGLEKFSLVAVVLGLCSFFGVCMHMASFLSFRSKQTLRAMAVRIVVFESKYNSRRLQGCINCRSYFGSMFYFSQTTIMELGHIVLDNTIQAVLTFP